MMSSGASCAVGVTAWLAERQNYSGSPIGSGDFYAYGHFTQIMRPTTTKMGCGISGDFLACEYYPAGNKVGQKLVRY